MKEYRNQRWYLEVLLNYLGRECVYCGSEKRIHVHHVIPLYLGGRNDLGNLEIVCSKCHHLIHKEISGITTNGKKTRSFVDGFCKRCNRYFIKKIGITNNNPNVCGYCLKLRSNKRDT